MKNIIPVMTITLVLAVLIIPNAFAEDILGWVENQWYTVQDSSVPGWVKNTAGWWATDAISETEFVNAIEFLVKENIIQVNVSQTSGTSQGVPDWIKNNAGWWADGQIDDQTFVNGIEYLIKVGIITLDNECKFEGAEFSHLSTDPLSSTLLNEYSSKFLLCKNIDLTFIDEFAHTVKPDYAVLNSHGFRGPEFSAEKPPNTYRIFLIGGSTMFGEHVDESGTKSAHLQKLFADQNLDFDIEVINAGISSAWSKTEIRMVKEKIINYDPDLLIVFDGWNDVTDELVKNSNWSKDANVENWVSRWTEICEIGKQNNFETIITVQPILGSGNKFFTNQESAEYLSHGYIPSHVRLLENYAYNLKNLESSCTKTADLTNAYDDVFLPVYTDLGHVNSLGGKIIAYEFFNLAVPIIFQDDTETQNRLLSENPSDQFKIKKIQKIESDNDFTGRLIENIKISNDLSDSRFWFADLRNVDFSNVNLVDVDFRFAKMINVSFKGATLVDVLMPRALVQNADFSDATLTNVRFSSSLVTYSNFEGSVLDNVEILGSYLMHNNFKNSEIKNMIFKRAHVINSNFSETEFKNVTLEDTVFTTTDFTGVDFSPIKIKDGVSFADSLFINSNISDYELPETDFANKILQSGCQQLGVEYVLTRDIFYTGLEDTCFFPSSDLSGLDFSKTDLSDVVFSRITTYDDKRSIDDRHFTRDYFGVILENTDLSNSNLSKNNLSSTIFTNADLSYTDLSWTDIRYSDLTNANLTGADLTNANLTGADLTNANLTGADLTNAKLNNAILTCLNHPICLNE
jgi:uncharacterized protein YjbI with pentapeptide repeats